MDHYIPGISYAQAQALSLMLRNASALPRWQEALSHVSAGTRQAHMLIMSDSTGAGNAASASGWGGNNMALCWPYQLASYYTAKGFRVNKGAVFGDTCNQSNTTTLASHDTRRSFGANWTLGAFYTLGGGVVSNANAATTLYSFTPAEIFDTIIVTTVNNAGYGVMSVAIDGGTTLQDINLATGGSVIARTTITVPRGTHRIDLFRAVADGGTTRNINAVSIQVKDSTLKAIDIINASVGGATSVLAADTSSYFKPLSVLPVFAPDLTIISLAINDWVTGVSAGTYDLVTSTTTGYNIQKLIDTARIYGDVVLVTGAPTATGSVSQATQNATLAAIRAVAAASNVPLVDIYAEWGNYADAATAGYYEPNDDVYHPGSDGYADIAEKIASVPGILGTL